MPRPTRCRLSTANLLHNFAALRAQAPHAKLLATIKANGFGHGMVEVARRLENTADGFGVASLDEALLLRAANIHTPITLLEGVFTPDELPEAAAQNCAVVFHAPHQIDWLERARLPRPLTAWLKLDSGLHRLGFAPNVAETAYARLARAPNVAPPIGLLSHLACADTPAHPLNAKQIAIFDAFVARHPEAPTSLLNSAGIFSFTHRHDTWVRPGLALYGLSPLDEKTPDALNLKHIMNFESQLIAVHNLSAGDTIGYGADFTCPEAMPVGIAAVGYGDGYPRQVAPGANVLIDGTPCPLVGRVAMDMLAVDLRPAPQAAPGARVTLWGDGLLLEHVAAQNGHSPYALACALQGRVPRIWE